MVPLQTSNGTAIDVLLQQGLNVLQKQGRDVLQQGLDVFLDVLGLEGAGVSLDRAALLVHQELLEVPGDVRPPDRSPDQEAGVGHQAGSVVMGRRQGGLQQAEQGVLAGPVHLDLVEHLAFELEAVAGPDVLEEVGDLLAAAVLLVAELVGGEGQDCQLVRVLLAQFVHLHEVPDGGASERRQDTEHLGFHSL